MKKLLLFIPVALLYLDLSGQVIDISEARSKPVGTVVTVSGIITCDTIGNYGVRYIQDITGGLCIYSFSFGQAVRSGDSVTITGTLKDYSNLLEMDPVSDYTIHTHNQTLPEPVLLTPSQLSESYEGMLVRINNALYYH